MLIDYFARQCRVILAHGCGAARRIERITAEDLVQRLQSVLGWSDERISELWAKSETKGRFTNEPMLATLDQLRLLEF